MTLLADSVGRRDVPLDLGQLRGTATITNAPDLTALPRAAAEANLEIGDKTETETPHARNSRARSRCAFRGHDRFRSAQVAPSVSDATTTTSACPARIGRSTALRIRSLRSNARAGCPSHGSANYWFTVACPISHARPYVFPNVRRSRAIRRQPLRAVRQLRRRRQRLAPSPRRRTHRPDRPQRRGQDHAPPHTRRHAGDESRHRPHSRRAAERRNLAARSPHRLHARHAAAIRGSHRARVPPVHRIRLRPRRRRRPSASISGWKKSG